MQRGRDHTRGRADGGRRRVAAARWPAGTSWGGIRPLLTPMWTRVTREKWMQTILHIHDTPERLAARFPWRRHRVSPFLGLHTLIALVLAFVFNLNRVAVVAGTWNDLPWSSGRTTPRRRRAVPGSWAFRCHSTSSAICRARGICRHGACGARPSCICFARTSDRSFSDRPSAPSSPPSSRIERQWRCCTRGFAISRI